MRENFKGDKKRREEAKRKKKEEKRNRRLNKKDEVSPDLSATQPPSQIEGAAVSPE